MASVANGTATAARAASASISANASARAFPRRGSAGADAALQLLLAEEATDERPVRVAEAREEVRRIGGVDEPVEVAEVPGLTAARQAREHLVEGQVLDLDVDPDRREVAADHAAVLEAAAEVARDQHRGSPPAVTGQAPRLLQVGSEGVDRGVAEARQCRAG